MRQLQQAGAPQGVWLVEIEAARKHLAALDSTLRRLSDAIVASYDAENENDPP